MRSGTLFEQSKTRLKVNLSIKCGLRASGKTIHSIFKSALSFF